MRSARAAARRDFPIPGSPEISTIWPSPSPGDALAFQQEIDLVLAADEIGQIHPADRFEATLRSRDAFDRPRRDRLGNALDLMPAKVAQAEKIAEQPTRGGGDHNRSRLGQGLKAGSKVRRVPDQSMLPQRTLAAGVADHHQAGRDANADCKRFRGARLEPCNGGNDIEPGPHGALRIVFVRAGIAEIGQNPVAPELGEKTVIGSRDPGAGSVIGVDHGAHVLRIESCG
jgi:hypothetical protein